MAAELCALPLNKAAEQVYQNQGESLIGAWFSINLTHSSTLRKMKSVTYQNLQPQNDATFSFHFVYNKTLTAVEHW